MDNQPPLIDLATVEYLPEVPAEPGWYPAKRVSSGDTLIVEYDGKGWIVFGSGAAGAGAYHFGPKIANRTERAMDEFLREVMSDQPRPLSDFLPKVPLPILSPEELGSKT